MIKKHDKKSMKKRMRKKGKKRNSEKSTREMLIVFIFARSWMVGGSWVEGLGRCSYSSTLAGRVPGGDVPAERTWKEPLVECRFCFVDCSSGCFIQSLM